MPIAGKAFDLLVILIENSSQPISKEDLMQKVWPESKVVTGNTFSVTLSSVRKALGDSARDRRYIVKSSIGYCFVANVRRSLADSSLVPAELVRTQRTGEGEDHTTESEREIPATASSDSWELNELKREGQTDLAYAIDISSKLALPFDGHLWHVIVGCAMYAALYVVALLVEVAYGFDQYGQQALMASPVVFVWIWVTAIAGMAVDWKRTVEDRGWGMVLALGIFLVSALALFVVSGLFLPNVPITHMSTTASTAQGAYLKAIIYFLVLATLFLVIPFHFVLAMQRELKAGRHSLALDLLTGERLAIAPQGAIFLRVWVMALLLGVIAIFALLLHHNLIDHLLPGAYQNMFINLLLLRLGLYHALATECLIWYYWGLNELKHECLLIEPVNRVAEEG